MSGDAWIGKCQNDVHRASECFTLLSRLSEFILALSKVSLSYCITHTNGKFYVHEKHVDYSGKTVLQLIIVYLD